MSHSIHVRHFDNPGDARRSVLDLMRECLQRESSRPHALMLSGGRTPLPIFTAIAAAPFPVSDTARVTYSDDRHVPVESPESNYGASLAMLEALGLGEDRVLRVHSELPLAEAGRRYHDDLDAFLRGGGVIDTALLGLGPDGHTCSLFNDADLERGAGRWAVHVPKESPPDRVSVTPDLLERVGRVVFVVLGGEKEAVVERLLNHPSEVIAGQAVARCPQVELWRG